MEFLWPIPVTIVQEWGLDDTTGTDKLSGFPEPALSQQLFTFLSKTRSSSKLFKTKVCLIIVTQIPPQSKKTV